jgi:hypothetical protein
METEDPREDVVSGSRRCSRCGRTKALELFVKQPAQKYGRGYHCKRCAAERVRAYDARKRAERVS